MSGYNLLKATLGCPHCGSVVPVNVEFRFGLLEFREYEVGEALEWGTRGLRYPRVRPAGGRFTGDGYVECPVCGRDYWVSIDVSADVIQSVRVIVDRPGYILGGDS
jgi:hypothetical protein